MRNLTTLALVLAFALAACAGGKKEAPKAGAPAKAEAAKAEAAKPAQAPKEPPAPPSEFDGLRKQVKDFVVLANACDKAWFSRVDPDKIDKWELPVDVREMEAQCDPLPGQYEALVKAAAFRNPRLDEYLRTAAMVADRYMFLALRCQKVSVRDKLPFKKMLSELRDALRTDIATLGSGLEGVLKLSDAELRDGGDLAGNDRAEWTVGAVRRLPADFQAWIATQRPENLPIWRFGLMTSAAMGTRAAAAMGAARLALDPALVKAGQDLATTFDQAWNFWSGDYFEAEEKGSPAHYKAMKKSADAWKKAFAKAYPNAPK